MSPTLSVLVTCLLIIVARIADVSIGTVRTMCVINGRRALAWVLGFVEVLIWILVVARVIEHVDEHWSYPLAYAAGFATGTFVGITVESRIAFGEQALRIFTRKGDALAAALRDAGHRVTVFDGRGRDGPVAMLYTETRRRAAPAVAALARRTDPECFYVVDDVRHASSASMSEAQARRAGVLSAFKG